MKKSFVVASFAFLCLLIAPLESVRAQCLGCVIDSTNCSGQLGAVCPDQLPDADNGVYYEEDVTFNLVPGFAIPGAGITLEVSEVVLSLNGLPQGLGYQFSPSTVFDPEDGDLASQYGCIKICGIPCSGDETYNIELVADYELSAFGFSFNIPVPFDLEMKVNSDYEPLEILSASEYLCPGGSINLAANDTHSVYQWSTGDNTMGTTVNATGIYTLQVTDTVNTNVCVLEDEIEIFDFNPNAGNPITICNGEVAQLSAGGADQFSWSPGAGLSDSTVAEPVILDLDSTTTFTVTGFNDSCSDVTQVTVTVDTTCPRTCEECIPDESCTDPICTTSLPLATASQAYETDFSFFFPYELDVNDFLPFPLPIQSFGDFTLESFRVENIDNLPAGLSWETDQKAAGNTYYPKLVEGVTGRGCVSICGTVGCVRPGNYTLQVEVWLDINGIPSTLLNVLEFLPQFENGELLFSIPVNMEVIYTNPLTVSPAGPVQLDYGDSVTLTASTNGLTGHEWSNGASGPEITVDTTGFYTVTANDGDCDQTFTVEVNVDLPPNSVEILELTEFEMYPNPANQFVNINWISDEELDVVSIYNAQGKKLFEKQLKSLSGQMTIDLSNWSSGLYFIQLSSAEGNFQQKLIKR